MPMSIATVLGTIVALVATIVAFVMIIPEKKRPQFAGNKFMIWLHDFLNFKTLWIEKILKFIYVLNTCTFIAIGFFMLFAKEGVYLGGFGILTMIIGPVITRIVYEFCMLSILTVKNLVEINNKLVPQKGSVADAAQQQPAPFTPDRPQF